MQDQNICEQFGSDRSREIDDLIVKATGRPCPGRLGGRCNLAPIGPVVEEEKIPRLRRIVAVA